MDRIEKLFWAWNVAAAAWLVLALFWILVSRNPLMCIVCCVVGAGCCLVGMKLRDRHLDPPR